MASLQHNAFVSLLGRPTFQRLLEAGLVAAEPNDSAENSRRGRVYTQASNISNAAVFAPANVQGGSVKIVPIKPWLQLK